MFTHRDPSFEASDLAKLHALTAGLERSYHADAVDTIRDLVENDPGRLFDVETATHILITDLRARGWSEQSLFRLLSAVADRPFDEAFSSLRQTITAPPAWFTCYIAVTLTGLQKQIPRGGDFEVVDEMPAAPPGMPSQTTATAPITAETLLIAISAAYTLSVCRR
jgi:hypothetical protein